MVDNLGTPDAPMMPPDETPMDLGAEKPPGFLSTTVGKLVVGGIAIVVVLGALAAIAFFFLIGQAADTSDIVVEQPGIETTSTASGEVSETPTPAPQPTPQDIFTNRNIFQPTVKVTVASSDSNDGGGSKDGDSDGGNVDVPPDTLYLSGVSTVDGEPVAELIWNGETYSLKEGQSIPGTPWKVLSISGDTVVMLYGDSRVTLTVGQGLSK